VQSVEDAVEVAVAQDVPRLPVEVDTDDIVAAGPQRLLDLRARAQRDLALG
jgi:hypothetical protein